MNAIFSLPKFRTLAVCGLTAALAASASAQVVNYEWTGAGGDNNWNNAANWNPSGVPAIGGSGSDQSPHTAAISGAAVSLSGTMLFAAAYDELTTGTHTALSLTDGATLQITGALRLRSVRDTTRNALIGPGSSFTSTSSGNALQLGSSDSTISTLSVQGSLQLGTMIGDVLPANSFEGAAGGYIVNIDGGLVEFSSTNFRFQGSNRHLNSIAQFHIRNDGVARLGTITRLSDAGYANIYIDFVDGTGLLEFSSTGYSTLAAVEGLINDGKIRLGGNTVDPTAFSVNSIGGGTGWQVGVIPEPSTYALLAGLVMLGGAVFVKRRRQQG